MPSQEDIHRRVQSLASRWFDGGLSPKLRRGLHGHLKDCAPCRAYYRDLDRLSRLARNLPSETLSAGFAARVALMGRRARVGARLNPRRIAAVAALLAGVALIVTGAYELGRRAGRDDAVTSIGENSPAAAVRHPESMTKVPSESSASHDVETERDRVDPQPSGSALMPIDESAATSVTSSAEAAVESNTKDLPFERGILNRLATLGSIDEDLREPFVRASAKLLASHTATSSVGGGSVKTSVSVFVDSLESRVKGEHRVELSTSDMDQVKRLLEALPMSTGRMTIDATAWDEKVRTIVTEIGGHLDTDRRDSLLRLLGAR